MNIASYSAADSSPAFRLSSRSDESAGARWAFASSRRAGERRSLTPGEDVRSIPSFKVRFPKLLDAPNELAQNLVTYINSFSKNVREIMERFAFDQQIARMAEKNLLFEVVKKFATLDLSLQRVDNVQMGYVFEELIRIGAEQSNEEAGDHFTPREVIRLMVNLLLAPEQELRRSHVVKTIYDPACGTGGMLSVCEEYIRQLNSEAKGKVQLIDARRFFVKMPKSLGNKRNKIGDPNDRAGEPNHIADLTAIFGNFTHGEMRTFIEEDAITKQPVPRERVVSKVFENADFGFYKITVDRPLRLNFQATPERIALLENESGFARLATSTKKNEVARLEEIDAGRARQDAIRRLLRTFAEAHGTTVYKDREQFRADLRAIEREASFRLSSGELKAIENALGERDEAAEICRDRYGKPEPDPELRDTESVPLKENIADYVRREVMPHVPDAWVDESKTKIGYEIPLNRHFYVYEPPRPLEAIEAELKTLENEIVALLKEVTA